jgi:hypothetical protein
MPTRTDRPLDLQVHDLLPPRAQLSVLKVCVGQRREAFEEIFCPDHWVSVVGERTSEASPAPQHGEHQSRALTATIAALKNPSGVIRRKLMAHPKVQA